jgi:hypothetical protein
MASGGKRIGSGRKSKYTHEEREKIIEVCKTVWDCKKYISDHIMVTLDNNGLYTKKIEIWDAIVTKNNRNNKNIGKVILPKSSIDQIAESNHSFGFKHKLFKKPKKREDFLKLSVLIIALLFPDRYHRTTMIDKIWKYKNIY